MVVIRLSRGGAKKKPFYSIVAADKRKARDGRNIEKLGFFNPVANKGDIRLRINLERIQHWVDNGAQPSNRVQSLIKEAQKAGTNEIVITEEHQAAIKEMRAAKKAKKAKAAEEKAKAEATAAEAETTSEEKPSEAAE